LSRKQLENAAIFLEITDLIRTYLVETAQKGVAIRSSQFKDIEISKRHIDLIEIKIMRISNGASQTAHRKRR